MRVARLVGVGPIASWIKENVVDAAPSWVHLFRSMRDNLGPAGDIDGRPSSEPAHLDSRGLPETAA